MDARVGWGGIVGRDRRARSGGAQAIFDAAYYLRQYPDVVAAGADPLSHFLSTGWAEGRNPCALFDTELYLERSPDVAQEGLNPLVHYIKSGAREGRQVSLLFDANWYLAKNPDIAEAARANPLAHYLAQGAAEGREANPLFDQAWYLKRYPDALAESPCALSHYAERGLRDRLSPHPLFDGAFYLDRYPDVARVGMNPLAHFLLRGHEEVRQPHALFDSAWYLRTSPDVAASRMNPLLHYVWEGAKEGRDPNAEFDAAWYIRQCPEAALAGVNPLVHYVTSEKSEKGAPQTLTSLSRCKREIVRRHQLWDADREKALLDSLARVPAQIGDIRVSIIMPTRNRAACIGRAISSVMAQSHRNWELVIVDDGSEDNTSNIVASFADRRIRYIANAVGRGVSAARNAGLDVASGDWIFFLDSDNRWRPHMLEVMLKFATTRGVNGAYCAADVFENDGSKKSTLYADFDMESCLASNFIDLNCFCLRRARSAQRFDVTLRRLVDWDYILGIAVTTPILGAPFVGVEYYDGQECSRITRTEHISQRSLEDLMETIRRNAINRILDHGGRPHHSRIERIAVVFHVYHKEFVADCLKYIKNIPIPFDLFVTTSHNLTDPALAAIRNEVEGAILLQYPNIGSDIAPFLGLVSTLSAYDLVCKIHTKRNTDRWGSAWRDALLSSVLASKEMVREIIRSFENDEHVLAAGGRAFFKLGEINSIPETQAQVRALAAAVGFNRYLDSDWSFFAGTVFWIRPRILTKLARSACGEPFFSKTFQRDGAIEHAWERLLGMSLLQVEMGKVVTTTIDSDAGFKLDVLRAAEGLREGITVTLDKMVAQKGNAYAQAPTVRRRVKISTVIPTYNQREFIRSAIESSVMQRGDFEHEVLVSDDGSTDGTQDVIDEYVARHPTLVRHIGSSTNRGISQNFYNCFQQASGDYIAVLEGDDYWLHADKLAKQMQFLEENTDCSMVFSKVEVLDVRNGTRTALKRQQRLSKTKLDGWDFLADPNMNLIANFSCCCFRARLMKQAPSDLFESRINEIAVAFYLEKYGKIGFIDEPLSVYRMHAGGVWTGSTQQSQLESGLGARRTAKKVAKAEYQAAIEAVIASKFALTGERALDTSPHPPQRLLNP